MCDLMYFLELYIKYNADDYKENDISLLSEEGYHS